MKKVILAYSGGLDTTCAIKWLKDKGFDVICFSAGLSSEYSPSDLKKRAIKSGASKIYVKDLRREFAYEYILKSLKANAVYEGKYVLSTALARPLIAKHLVEIARIEKANFVAHGCTAKGNDQVRFEVAIMSLAPKLNIIAPLREWELRSRTDEIEYAKKHKLPIKATYNKPYSIDKNIWGISIEGGVLEDITKEPPLNSYYIVKPLSKVKDEESEISISFKNGKPIALNSKRLDFVNIIERLNLIGAKYGIGRTDLIEDRVVGIKSREIYEAPAAWILLYSHRELENLTLDRDTLSFLEFISNKYAQLIYQGLWFTNLKEALDAFIEKTQINVNGTIALRLYKGNIITISRDSEDSLYKEELATYSGKDKFDKNLASGFIKIFAMPYKFYKKNDD